MADEASGEAAQQQVRPRPVAGSASDIEAEADCQIGALTHTIRQSGENLAALVDRKPDDQYPALGFSEQFAQHDTDTSLSRVNRLTRNA